MLRTLVSFYPDLFLLAILVHLLSFYFLSICVANQQIQTEIVKTVEQHVQAGSTGKQQGVCCENKYEEEETIDIAALLSFYSDLFILCNNSDTVV